MGEEKETTPLGVESKVHQRRIKPATVVVPTSQPSSSRSNIVNWFTSLFTSDSIEKIDTALAKVDSKEVKSPIHRSSKCKHFFCILLILFCVTYAALHIWPEQALLLRNSIENVFKRFNLTSEEHRIRPGEQLAKFRQASSPIIIIPGIISTGLELWQGTECTKGQFRHRFWTSMQTVDAIGRDHQCWLKHVSLNLTTWKDPESIRLRPILGWAAADYVFPGYWLWSKVLQNLADIGYDTTNLMTMGYDWRLPPQVLEERDGYYTQLKFYAEFLRKKHGKKVVLLTHSMGTNYVLYFLRWVTEKAGDKWIDEYVSTFLNVGGPLLGTPKAFSAVLSGEMKDTSVLGDLGRNILGRVVGKLVVFPRFFRALGSIPSMFPRGGNAVWQECSGSQKHPTKHMLVFPVDQYRGFAKKLIKIRKECEEEVDYKDGFDSILEEIYAKPELVEEMMTNNHTVEQFYDILRTIAPRYMNLVDKYYDLDGTTRTKPDADKPKDEKHEWKTDPRFWTDPLVTPLPNVTNLKIYCMYGYIKEAMTECAYSYGFYPFTDYCSSALVLFNTSTTVPSKNIKSGVYLGPGDATVPLVSLGHMCAGPWKETGSHLNPGRVKTIIREYIHKTTAFDILTTHLEDAVRGGQYAVTHVELLGNRDFLTDLLMIVSEPIPGTNQSQLEVNDDSVKKDHIHSNIREMSARIMHRQSTEE